MFDHGLIYSPNENNSQPDFVESKVQWMEFRLATATKYLLEVRLRWVGKTMIHDLGKYFDSTQNLHKYYTMPMFYQIEKIFTNQL